ncbi:TPA: carbon starvation protein A, partial [Serratia marcescens]|nr:carbon starvation protein A [Serratia marcescens]
KMKKQRYAWVTILPTAWLFVTSMTAGWQKIFHEKPSIGFLAQAKKFSTGIEQGTIIAPAKSLKDMETIVFSNQINAALCGFFMLVAVTMLIAAFFAIRRALRSEQPTTHEVSAALREETGRG